MLYEVITWAGPRLDLVTRGFPFPDGSEASQQLKLEFSGAGLNRIRDAVV